jgi:colanic acid/amylovoran biosynthesis glycosyltransferase
VYEFPVYSETFIAGLASSLLEANCDLEILALHGRGATAGVWPQLEDVTHRPMPLPPVPGTLGQIIETARQATMLRRRPKYEVAHCQFATLGLLALRHIRLGTLRTRALVVHIRGHDITAFTHKHGNYVYRDLFRRADLFIANSEYFKDRAVSLGCPTDKIVVIGSPIDTERFAPPAAREVPNGRQVRLVLVGRLVEKKGIADAIEAVALLAARGRDVRLDILGEGECRADLEARIARAGLGDRVTLQGQATQAQVIAALHGADIALAPSVTASTGDADAAVNTAKEAMATGLPVIATWHGGIPELVIPGENGDLVPERDPVALAASIARLMDDPSSCARFGRAGRARVVTEYERSRILEKTLEAYRMALARGGGGSHD